MNKTKKDEKKRGQFIHTSTASIFASKCNYNVLKCTALTDKISHLSDVSSELTKTNIASSNTPEYAEEPKQSNRVLQPVLSWFLKAIRRLTKLSISLYLVYPWQVVHDYSQQHVVCDKNTLREVYTPTKYQY